MVESEELEELDGTAVNVMEVVADEAERPVEDELSEDGTLVTTEDDTTDEVEAAPDDNTAAVGDTCTDNEKGWVDDDAGM